VITIGADPVTPSSTTETPAAGLAELEARLLALAAISEDDHRFVLGQALDTAAALLAAHARRAAA
jgi:hypothetical protein